MVELLGASTAVPRADKPREELRVYEFFSGIGGMRLALEACLSENPLYTVGSATAVECSDICNAVYSFNFPEGNSSCLQVNIESLRVGKIDGQADVWTLSPPCQVR